MVSKEVISPILINGVFLGVKKPTDPITFDPNFQSDIQVGFHGMAWLLSLLGFHWKVGEFG